MADGDPILEPLSTAGIAPNTPDYLVGTTQSGLTAEIVVGTSPGGELGGTWGTPTVDATHSGSSHAGVVTAHEAAGDPHTGYRLESADHSHQTTGAQGGKLDHGLALDGLADDDHPQYQLAASAASILTAYKDSDQEVTDTTLAGDSELTVTLALNGKYQFELKLFFLNDGAAEGIKVGLGGTATVTDVKAQVSIYDDTLNSLVAFGRITALGGAGIGAGVSSGSNFTKIEGAIEITTAGTFLLQFAQNATGASAGVHCEVGSSMVVTKLE
jgi:hypothetical protein